MKKIALISLGCPKNLVDSENILAILGEKKYILTDTPDHADLIILNTCGFIKPAVEETENYIKKLVSKKKKLLVVGCLAQRYPEKLQKYKGIGGLVGTGDPEKVASAVAEIFQEKKPVKVSPSPFITKKEFPRLLLTYPYAYLKISEGCNNFCHYCLIPYLRGRLRSRKMKSLVAEAKSLEKIGIKELILVAQDTTSYGKDLKNGSSLTSLLKQLVKLQFHWLRILYTYPSHIDDSLIETIRKNKKICSYLDIPIQHVHPEILKKMGRPIMDYQKFFEKLRKDIPNLHLRTTFILGFPGETEKHFHHLLEFIKEAEFDRVGFFKYSREEGTPAYNFQEQVPEEVKEERMKELVKIQRRISRKNLKKMVGRKIDVLIDKKEGSHYIGRTEYDAPEIDGVVYIHPVRDKTPKVYDGCQRQPISNGVNLKPGEIYKVLITKSTDYDLYGRITTDER